MKDDPLNRLKVKRGEELPWSKLTEEDIRLINLLVEERTKMRDQLRQLTNRKIADKFGVSRRTIDRITAGETWGHVI